MRSQLYRLLNVPDKCPETELLSLLVHLMECIEQRIYFSFVYNSNNSRAHAGPCMTAIVRLTRLAATSLHLLPLAESTATLAVEQRHATLKECLVECYKY